MATVGNLFINIRGKTEKFERDLKRSTRRVSKSFARDQERAMIQLREARERVSRMTTASPERFGAAMSNLRKAEHNVRMAESRQTRMEAWRRAYENRKEREKDKRVKRWSIEYEIYKRKRLAHEEHMNRRRDRLRQRDLLRQQAGRQLFGKRGMAAQLFQASPLAGFLTVLGAVGLTISTAKSIVDFAVRNARRGSELTERFKFAGPMGGQIAQTEAAKIQQQLRFAQDPSISAAKARKAGSELVLEESQMKLSSTWDNFVAFLNQFSSSVLSGGLLPGQASKVVVEQEIRVRQAAGLTGQGP